MKLTVLGATGGTGRHIVDQALDAGHQVTAVVRDPTRLPVSHPNLEVITADITDTDALVPTVHGSTAVLSALAATAKGGNIATRGVRAVLAAMSTSDTRRLIAISAAPVGPVPAGESFLSRAILTPAIRRIFRDAYTDLATMESEIRHSTTEWTIVRPPRLLNTPVTTHYRTRIGSNIPGGHQISRADLAHAMLAMLTEPETFRRAVGVAD
ncbi:NAD(P)-dependent oxidoreductase [Nocardia otitidiscaviarum]|uniref:NAD(P)-dependent oxidoreductase n=1 Tax=Nocardia otitidiscaviarum TaxID=1823 RepID=UPI0018939348|nr:NAD(P)H-binding protein [Nocardia otitidiscaviarum]MBF6180799.1 NAD(P)H-binding protein [Nocardia otitidiscaviarum]